MPKENKKIILIAEDDEILLRALYLLLRGDMYTIASAGDGETALKMTERLNPNLVLLDLLMPKMDGFEVLEKVKGDAKTKNIPVILLTNLGQKEDVDKGLKLGASDYLIKAHFMPQETVEKVKKVLAANPARSGK